MNERTNYIKPKVFVSVGTASTNEQAEAAEMIFQSLERAGLSPRQMNKNEWSSEQPLRAIRNVIKECDGAVIIAFTRYYFATGMERLKEGHERTLHDVRNPTVWNQIEAAMAYARGLPLLVVAERGLRDDGLLEGRYDWQVFWTDFNRREISSSAFTGFIETWKRLVIEQASSSAENEPLSLNDLSKIPLSVLIGRLSLPHLWKAISAVVGLIVGIAAIAFSIGRGEWPWQ